MRYRGLTKLENDLLTDDQKRELSNFDKCTARSNVRFYGFVARIFIEEYDDKGPDCGGKVNTNHGTEFAGGAGDLILIRYWQGKD